jgi:hypothetical protein
VLVLQSVPLGTLAKGASPFGVAPAAREAASYAGSFEASGRDAPGETGGRGLRLIKNEGPGECCHSVGVSAGGGVDGST